MFVRVTQNQYLRFGNWGTRKRGRFPWSVGQVSDRPEVPGVDKVWVLEPIKFVLMSETGEHLDVKSKRGNRLLKVCRGTQPDPVTSHPVRPGGSQGTLIRSV